MLKIIGELQGNHFLPLFDTRWLRTTASSDLDKAAGTCCELAETVGLRQIALSLKFLHWLPEKMCKIPSRLCMLITWSVTITSEWHDDTKEKQNNFCVVAAEIIWYRVFGKLKELKQKLLCDNSCCSRLLSLNSPFFLWNVLNVVFQRTRHAMKAKYQPNLTPVDANAFQCLIF